jgi:hypothetical protein
MRKTKILVECPQKIASVRVGVLGPLQPLENASLCSIRYRDTKDITREDIVWCDVLISVRGCENPTLQVVEAAKMTGRFLIYFLDDDLLNIPQGNASSNYYNDNKIKSNIIDILSMSNVLWAVNRNVINKYSKWCSRTVLSRVPGKILACPSMNNEEKTHILYAGSADHGDLVRNTVVPAIKRVLEKYQERVDFTFIGADPHLEHVNGVTFYPFFESYDAYQAAILSGKFKIGLAPAYNTQFYSCKYFNKFIEYSSFGIVGIYSDCEPYTQIVSSEKNGLLCGSTTEDWYKNINRLIDEPTLAYDCVTEAQRLLRSDFNEQVVTDQLLAGLPELISFTAPDIIKSQVQLPYMRWIFYKERILLLYRIYGISAIYVIPCKAIRKIWKMIKKCIRSK